MPHPTEARPYSLSRRGTLTALTLLLGGGALAWKGLPAMAAEPAVVIAPPRDAGTPTPGATPKRPCWPAAASGVCRACSSM